MANTTINSNNVVTKFLSDFFKEYVRQNRFSRYIGTGPNNVIVIKEDEKKVSIPLITKLDGNGVEGNATLEGNEESLGNYAFTLTPTYYRHGVRVTNEEKEKTAIDIMRAAREMLMQWAMEKTRNQIIKALGSVYDGTNVRIVDNTDSAYDTSANTWVVNNSDRVLFGAAASNYNADFSTALANVDATDDKLSYNIVRLARSIAEQADPLIRPIRFDEDSETYVMFVGSRSFKDLQENLDTIHQNASIRGENNPLFRPGDLLFDNVVIRKIPEITTLLTASTKFATKGNGSQPVEPCFLCGAQALGFGLGMRPNLVVDADMDYGFQPGCAVEMKHDIEKITYNNKDHGIVTVFVDGTNN